MNADVVREVEAGADEPRVLPEQRAAHIQPGYSPAAHIVRTVTLSGVIGGLATLLATRARAIDWVVVPIFFVVANFIEWAVHRGPMHRPMTPRLMYRNHTLIHHRAFHHDSMPIGSARELDLIMMPWYTMLGLFVLAAPVALVAALLRGPGMAGIFYLCAASYFLVYETLHASYHLPERTLARLGLAGNGVFERLRGHHRHHHRLDRMSRSNYNVTFPLMDWLLGTREREDQPPTGAGKAGA